MDVETPMQAASTVDLNGLPARFLPGYFLLSPTPAWLPRFDAPL